MPTRGNIEHGTAFHAYSFWVKLLNKFIQVLISQRELCYLIHVNILNKAVVYLYEFETRYSLPCGKMLQTKQNRAPV